MSEIAAMRRKPSLHPVPMMLPEFGGQNGPDPEGSLCFLTRLPFGNADVIGTLKVDPNCALAPKQCFRRKAVSPMMPQTSMDDLNYTVRRHADKRDSSVEPEGATKGPAALRSSDRTDPPTIPPKFRLIDGRYISHDDRAAWQGRAQASGASSEPDGANEMPKIKVNDITMNYEQQGTGEPLVLIPYLAADHACYAFQVADYAKHFTCISVDPRGAGETDKPAGKYSTQLFADDVAAFIHAINIDRAHVSGLSLGAATGMWLAAKYPQIVRSLSLHSGWTKTDPFLKVVVQGWQTMAVGLASVTDMVIQGIFPWCFTPELYAAKPDHIESLAAFVRGRPVQPLEAFLQQSEAVIAHDAGSALAQIKAPTQITFGRRDVVTSTRFADAMKNGIGQSEMTVFEDCAHAPIYENVAEFNDRTLNFLKRNSG
jgi:pimeloyl-ACP methyl ester carboxylesterase